MQPGWSHGRIGGVAAASKIGSDKRRRIAIQYGQSVVGWQGCGASCGPAVRLNRAGLRHAQERGPALVSPLQPVLSTPRAIQSALLSLQVVNVTLAFRVSHPLIA